MKILLDSGIFIHSEFAEDAIKSKTVRLGGNAETHQKHGYIRKNPDKDTDNQSQKNALFTLAAPEHRKND